MANPFVKAVLPWFSAAIDAAKIIPGPIGVVAGIVSKVTGKDVKAEPAAVEAAIAGATPAEIAQMQEHEQQFGLDMQKLKFADAESLAKIAADDRASARNREIEVKDRTPRNLAYLYAAGFFITLAAEIWIAISGRTINPLAAKSIDMLLGVLIGMVLGTKEYYFGSSVGSDKKTDLLADIAKS